MEFSDRLVRALASPYADEAAVRRRLDAWAAHPDDRAAQRAATVLGGVTRTRGRDATLAACEATLDLVDWSHPAFGSNQAHPRIFALLSSPMACSGRATLLDTAAADLVHLLGLVEAPARRTLASSLVRWIEFGDEDALPAACEALAGCSLDRSIRSTESFGAQASRAAWLQLAPLRGDLTAVNRALAQRAGSYGVRSAVGRLLAERTGVGPVSPGLDCERGGRTDLHGEEARPWLEFLARHDRGLFEELVGEALDTPWIRPTPLRAAALDDITADEEAGVYAADGRWVEVRRFGRVVGVARDAPKAASALSTAKSEKAARGVYARKVAEAESSLGATAGARHPALADANEALREAARAVRRSDLRRALAAGADPNVVVDDDAWRALHVVSRQDAQCVRALLAAGADPNARTAHGVTALYLALSASLRPWVPACIDALLAAGAADVPYQGRSLVAHAATAGYADVTAAMVRAGFAIDARDDGRTPRDHAAATDQLHVVATLDALGATTT